MGAGLGRVGLAFSNGVAGQVVGYADVELFDWVFRTVASARCNPHPMYIRNTLATPLEMFRRCRTAKAEVLRTAKLLGCRYVELFEGWVFGVALVP
jgi:hypothetical protein